MSKLDWCTVGELRNFQLTASEMFQFKTLNVEFDNVRDQFNDFYFKLVGCLDMHTPLKN